MNSRNSRRASRRAAYRREFADAAADIVKVMREHGMDTYTHHRRISTLAHSVAVAYFSMRLAEALHIRCNRRDLIRGALLHDYFLYDNNRDRPPHRFHNFTHPKTALKNADRDFILTDLERDVIRHHMFPLTPFPPRHVEGALVCLVDKACAVYEVFSLHPYRHGFGLELPIKVTT